MSKQTVKYSPEARERAVWMVLEHQDEHGSQWAATSSTSPGPTPADREHERQVLDAIHDVVAYSAENAARKNVQRYGIFLADAIPAWRIGSAVFWERQWSHLRERMSPDHAQTCERLAGR